MSKFAHKQKRSGVRERKGQGVRAGTKRSWSLGGGDCSDFKIESATLLSLKAKLAAIDSNLLLVTGGKP